ncbi:AsnC family transcriptional regulator [Roseobacter cerasinus]|uniref:AsnC family transcriptional regulator n=1 Tax=Roseobacter cerasinus TaxID=2602289 RepID=A0A640VTY3_9RHOB|nr:Lrp/AsnC family transcriptional regulator [Roseobacter cerasinus]GFE51848.1 AsnC family transcriptional regulator [Roseobacter cerasinus]
MSAMDEKDRKIINILQKDADITNAALGEQVGLSGPGVHERIKRLKAAGIILGNRLMIDPEKVGRSLLSFVLLKTNGSQKQQQVAQLVKVPEIEEIHSTAGQFSILLKVRTEGPAQMEELYERLYEIPGIDTSETVIVFKSFLDRGTYVPDIAT